MENQKVTIIGTGLVGGSLGLALKQEKALFRIVGHDRQPEVAKKAKARGAVHEVEGNLVSAVEGAAFIFITTPLPGVKEVLEKAAPYLQPGAILTDTAPAKEITLEWAREYLPEGVHFIGGHPILPESGEGIEGAREDLFQGMTWCLVPAADSEPQAMDFLVQLVQGLGAQPFFMDAAEHDGQVTALEHLPPVLAAALFHIACHSPAWRDMSRLVSVSFQQATALPRQDPEALSQLALSNPRNLSHWIDLLIDELHRVQGILSQKDGEGFKEFFTDPTLRRQGWMEKAWEDKEAQAQSREQAHKQGSLSRLFGFLPRRPGKQ